MNRNAVVSIRESLLACLNSLEMIEVDRFSEGQHTGDHHHIGWFIHAQPGGINVGKGLGMTWHALSTSNTKDFSEQADDKLPHKLCWVNLLSLVQVYPKKVEAVTD